MSDLDLDICDDCLCDMAAQSNKVGAWAAQDGPMTPARPVGSVRDLIGLTIRSMSDGCVGDPSVVFYTACGRRYELFCAHDCCDRHPIVEVVGDYDDLLHVPLLHAQDLGDQGLPGKVPGAWIFYKFGLARGDIQLGTSKGVVVIRWLTPRFDREPTHPPARLTEEKR